MSASRTTPEPVEHISIEDLKHRAEEVRDLAVSDTKAAVDRVLAQDATRALLIAAGVVVAVASVAYLAGSRRARSAFLDGLG